MLATGMGTLWLATVGTDASYGEDRELHSPPCGCGLVLSSPEGIQLSSSGAYSACPDSGTPGGCGGGGREASRDSFGRLPAWTVSEKNILLALAAVSWNPCECDI